MASGHQHQRSHDDQRLEAGRERIGETHGLGVAQAGTEGDASRARRDPHDDDDGVEEAEDEQAAGGPHDDGNGPDQLEPAGDHEEEPVNPRGAEMTGSKGEMECGSGERQQRESEQKVGTSRSAPVGLDARAGELDLATLFGEDHRLPPRYSEILGTTSPMNRSRLSVAG